MTKRQILGAQGLYYVATGLWPLVSMRSFERITGPKVDKWLVQMIGLLATSIGASLLVGTRRDNHIDNGVLTLAVLGALSFATIDVVHSARHRISPIYLGDAVCELLALASLARTRA